MYKTNLFLFSVRFFLRWKSAFFLWSKRRKHCRASGWLLRSIVSNLFSSNWTLNSNFVTALKANKKSMYFQLTIVNANDFRLTKHPEQLAKKRAAFFLSEAGTWINVCWTAAAATKARCFFLPGIKAKQLAKRKAGAFVQSKWSIHHGYITFTYLDQLSKP